jgi:predicted Rossmann fold nucleotide-binding protein DprA/Smf involved in DNA uptake
MVDRSNHIVCLSCYDVAFPRRITELWDKVSLKSIYALGNIKILGNEKIAVYCSVKCPGNLIIRTYDLMKRLRDSGVVVISGFHSPIEKECLRILLRGRQPIIACPARCIEGMRVPIEYKHPLEDHRLLLLSPFAEKQRRTTAQMAAERNRFVAALADTILVVYAESGSKTERFCREILRWGKPVYTFPDVCNENLLSLGAQPLNSFDELNWS